jgi:hypothetical protein
MAPEQIRGEDPARAADIYSLGILLYEMLTGGQRPFNGRSPQSRGTTAERIRWEQVHLPAPSPRRYNAAISIELEGILLRCLDKDPGARFSSAPGLLSALEQPLSLTATRAAPPVSGPLEKPGPAAPVRKDRSKILKFWLFAAIPLIVLLVFMAGGGAGNPSIPVPQDMALGPFASPRPSFTLFPYDSYKGPVPQCISCAAGDELEAVDSPGRYSWELDFPHGSAAEIAWGWCAADPSTLASNWPHIGFTLTIDDRDIDLSRLQFYEGALSDRVCRGYGGALTGWTRGGHTYTWTQHIYRAVNDGFTDYQAGDYVFHFVVTVK